MGQRWATGAKAAITSLDWVGLAHLLCPSLRCSAGCSASSSGASGGSREGDLTLEDRARRSRAGARRAPVRGGPLVAPAVGRSPPWRPVRSYNSYGCPCSILRMRRAPCPACANDMVHRRGGQPLSGLFYLAMPAAWVTDEAGNRYETIPGLPRPGGGVLAGVPAAGGARGKITAIEVEALVFNILRTDRPREVETGRIHPLITR